MPKGINQTLMRIFGRLSFALTCLGAIILAMTVIFVAYDVFARYVLNMPTKGDFELIVLATGLIAAFGLADAVLNDRHIRIDIATSHLPRIVRRVLDVTAYFLGSATWALIAWRVTVYAFTVKNAHSISGMLPIPVYPFVFLVAFGCALLCVAFLTKLAQSVTEVTKA